MPQALNPPDPRSSPRPETLVRDIGVRQLTASIVNTTVGAGIFLLPALVAQGLGAAAPIAYLVCGASMALIVTTFAIAGSRVSATGGLFVYVETAFGPFVGFLAGTLQWLAAVLAAGGVSIALLDALSVIWPAFKTDMVRMATLALTLGGLAAINVRGVRAGARTIEFLTVAKLLPLLCFVVLGAFAVQSSSLAWPGMPATTALGRAVLLIFFAFAGVEVALTPSGEIKDPSSTVPRSIYYALAFTTTLYIAIQLVAQGVLGPELALHTQAPIADASSRFIGRVGATVMFAGALISMLGYISGDMLGSPRNLYAFGRDGFLPAAFARVHPTSSTPRLAIWTHAMLVFAVASSGTFQFVAIVTNVCTLTLYLLCCFASMSLMRRDVRADGEPFVIRGATAIAVGAVVAIAVILSSATWKEFAATGAMLVVASFLYLLRRKPVSQTAAVT